MTASFQGSGNTFNWNGVAGQTMLSGFLNGNPMAVNLANIPYASYDVYIYYAGFGSNYSLTWQATNTATSSVLGTQYSVRGTKSSVQLFADSGWVQSQYATLALADAAAAGNGGNWLKFSGLTAANLKIAETSANGNNENGFSGIQIVNTAVSNTFASWIGAFQNLGSATGFNDDADGDGIKNGLEYFLGTDPSRPTAGLTAVSAVGQVLKFRHSRSNSLGSDVSAAYQWSSDLIQWYGSGQTNGLGVSATIASAVITDTNAPDNDLIEVTVTVSGTTADKIFARISATQSP